MDIYKDDCNESELYSEECMVEDWTGEKDSECFGNDTREHWNEILLKRETVFENNVIVEDSKSGNQFFVDSDSHLPFFTEWTLYDKLQRRIYATYKDDESLAEAIRASNFSSLWRRIALDRQLAFTVSELNHIGYLGRFASNNVVVFIRKNLELYPKDWMYFDDDVCVPTQWGVREIRKERSDNISPAIASLTRNEEESRYPF